MMTKPQVTTLTIMNNQLYIILRAFLLSNIVVQTVDNPNKGETEL